LSLGEAGAIAPDTRDDQSSMDLWLRWGDGLATHAEELGHEDEGQRSGASSSADMPTSDDPAS